MNHGVMLIKSHEESELPGKEKMETLSNLKFFRKLKKKTVLTVFNIITEKRFTVGHKTRWELANEITEKFMSVDHIRDKVGSGLFFMKSYLQFSLIGIYLCFRKLVKSLQVLVNEGGKTFFRRKIQLTSGFKWISSN